MKYTPEKLDHRQYYTLQDDSQTFSKNEVRRITRDGQIECAFGVKSGTQYAGQHDYTQEGLQPAFDAHFFIQSITLYTGGYYNRQGFYTGTSDFMTINKLKDEYYLIRTSDKDGMWIRTDKWDPNHPHLYYRIDQLDELLYIVDEFYTKNTLEHKRIYKPINSFDEFLKLKESVDPIETYFKEISKEEADNVKGLVEFSEYEKKKLSDIFKKWSVRKEIKYRFGGPDDELSTLDGLSRKYFMNPDIIGPSNLVKSELYLEFGGRIFGKEVTIRKCYDDWFVIDIIPRDAWTFATRNQRTYESYRKFYKCDQFHGIISFLDTNLSNTK